MTAIRDTLEKIVEMRSMFPRCFYCGRDLSATPIRDLVIVTPSDHTERLAHKTCPNEASHAA